MEKDLRIHPRLATNLARMGTIFNLYLFNVFLVVDMISMGLARFQTDGETSS